jgi:type II secretory pathway pseudopilin PulG
MNVYHSLRNRRSGVTLIEMTLVIFLLIALMSTGLFFSGKISEWKSGREASETLRGVYSAQRLYLADNPTTTVSSLTTALLLPYLPNRPATFPTITSLTNTTLTVRVTVSPPTINNGSGGSYDPSGNSKDSLWDVGE